jgi:hypothetical protein
LHCLFFYHGNCGSRGWDEESRDTSCHMEDSCAGELLDPWWTLYKC